MGRKLHYSTEDDSNEIVKRYEAFLSDNSVSGYFDVEEMESIVDFYLRKGRTRDSSKALDFGFRLHPNSSALMIKRAKIYLATGDINKAYNILESHSEQSDYDVILLKIDALIRLQRDNEAFLLCDDLINSSNSDIDDVCLDIAYIFLFQSDFISAKKYLLKGEEYNPLNDELLFELAFSFERTEEVEKAIATYNKLIKLDPFTSEAWFNLGQIYYSQNNYQLALEAFEYASAIRPEDSLTCLQKGHTHYQLQQYNEALSEYFAFNEMTSSQHTLYFIGECYEQMENYPEALRYYLDALKDDPDSFDTLTGIAICLMELDLYAESLPFLNRAAELQEEEPEVWIYIGEVLTELDDIDGALDSYLKAIKLNYNQPDILMAIANIYMDKKQFLDAVVYYKNALKYDVHKELENIHLLLSVAYHFTGDIELSYKHLQIAAENNLDAYKLFEELCSTL